MTSTTKFYFFLCALMCSATINSVYGQSSAVAINAEDYKGRLDHLLTLEMAAKISGFDASQATKEHGNDAHKAFGGEPKPPRECYYLWDHGREASRTIGGNTIAYKAHDRVGINSVSNTTLERFERSYPVLTTEQKADAQKRLTEEHAKQTANSANPAHQASAQLGSDMIQNLEVEIVEGVGEAARWYPRSNELKVFHRGLSFAVVVDVSDDKNVNRTKAIALAKALIEKQLK